MIDIANKTCINEGCTVKSYYNLFGHKAEFCKKHAPPNAIMHPNPRCTAPQCTSLATHGSKSIKRPIHCEYHSDPKTEFDKVSKPCSSCNLPSIIDEDGKCFYCNPTNALKYLHTKELKVKEYLDDNSIIYDQHDKVIDGGKLGKERPDFLFIRETHCVILEVDENQHSERPCECEQVRMVNISQSLGLPTVFIRYNPDKYKKPDKVKKMQNEDHDTRMKYLAQVLDEYLTTPPNAFLTVTQLFFDEWNGEHQLMTILDFEDSTPKIYEDNNINEYDEEGESEEKTITVKYEKVNKITIVKVKPKIVIKKKQVPITPVLPVAPVVNINPRKPKIIVKRRADVQPVIMISVKPQYL
jgi:hypothetical protein